MASKAIRHFACPFSGQLYIKTFISKKFHIKYLSVTVSTYFFAVVCRVGEHQHRWHIDVQNFTHT